MYVSRACQQHSNFDNIQLSGTTQIENGKQAYPSTETVGVFGEVNHSASLKQLEDQSDFSKFPFAFELGINTRGLSVSLGIKAA